MRRLCANFPYLETFEKLVEGTLIEVSPSLPHLEVFAERASKDASLRKSLQATDQ
jgi:hypothetical protein